MARVASAFVSVVAAVSASFYDLTATDIDGNQLDLKEFAGNISVVMNVATFWGFTASNYAMLKRLQSRYADQPVRFFVVPCNQFGGQEPKSNEEVKAFAQQFVKLGSNSNVVMLAKSNLNDVPCAARAADACLPSSTTCCPANDPIYDYLLAATSPGKIVWNFDKIVVDGSGRPFPGETVLHGGDLDDVLAGSIVRAGDGIVEAALPQNRWSSLSACAFMASAAALAAVAGRKFSKACGSHADGSQELPEQYIVLK